MELYFTIATHQQRKSYGVIFYDLEGFPYLDFKVMPLFDVEHIRNGTGETVTVNWDLHIACSRVSFRMTLSDLE